MSLFIASCSDYQKVLKSPDEDLKYDRAMKYFEKKDYARSQALFENIQNFVKGTSKAEEVFYRLAYCYYNQDDYILGGYYFRNFAKSFPASKYAEECMYMGAYCYYLDSPPPSLDQENTVKAISELQFFVQAYPSSTHIEQCNKLIDELRLKLQKKSYMSGKLYFDLGDYKASTISLRNSLKEYPDSPYREELLFLITKANYLYASNSIEIKKKERFEQTIKSYYEFVDEFPSTKYQKEITKIYDESIKYIK